MADAHLQQVQRLYEQSAQVDSVALNADPDVVSAFQELESARRALNLDRHNPDRQQHLRDCEKNYLSATNSFFHNVKMAKIEASKVEKKRKVDAENAVLEERRREQAEMTVEKAALLKKYATVL